MSSKMREIIAPTIRSSENDRMPRDTSSISAHVLQIDELILLIFTLFYSSDKKIASLRIFTTNPFVHFIRMRHDIRSNPSLSRKKNNS